MVVGVAVGASVVVVEVVVVDVAVEHAEAEAAFASAAGMRFFVLAFSVGGGFPESPPSLLLLQAGLGLVCLVSAPRGNAGR